MRDIRQRHTALLAASLLALTLAACAPPEAPEDEARRPRPAPTKAAPTPRVTDVFPDGTAVSAVRFWHDNPELVPQVLDGSTLLLDAAGSGASTIAVPAAAPEESLVLVLTCARPSTYSLSLVHEESHENFATTTGESCGGPTITVFPTPPLPFSGGPASIDIDVPDDTGYYLAVYRTVGAAQAS